MAKLSIKKYVSKNKKNKSYGKTYGRLVHRDTLHTLDVAKHIQKHGTVYTQDVIVGVLQRFSTCIEELLQEGYKVKLDGLGTFYLSVQSTGDSDPDKYDAGNIVAVRIRFLADKSKAYDWSMKSQTLRAQFVIPRPEGSSAAGGNSGSSGTSGSDSGDNTGDNTGGGDDNTGGDNTEGGQPAPERP